jgi:hypothetical protein
MKHRSRRPRRFRRPLPPPPTRSQIRQRIGQVCSLYRLEFVLEAQKPAPDPQHLGRLHTELVLMNEALTHLEEQA